jgi:hypothetical protein
MAQHLSRPASEQKLTAARRQGAPMRLLTGIKPAARYRSATHMRGWAGAECVQRVKALVFICTLASALSLVAAADATTGGEKAVLAPLQALFDIFGAIDMLLDY